MVGTLFLCTDLNYSTRVYKQGKVVVEMQRVLPINWLMPMQQLAGLQQRQSKARSRSNIWKRSSMRRGLSCHQSKKRLLQHRKSFDPGSLRLRNSRQIWKAWHLMRREWRHFKRLTSSCLRYSSDYYSFLRLPFFFTIICL